MTNTPAKGEEFTLRPPLQQLPWEAAMMVNIRQRTMPTTQYTLLKPKPMTTTASSAEAGAAAGATGVGKLLVPAVLVGAALLFLR